jgi:hypothetical protein
MKVRTGFVSNSSSSSFLCVGVSDKGLIDQLLEAEGFKEEEEGSGYEGEGYGALEGKVVNFYGSSACGWQAAGLDEDVTKKLLEKMILPEARKEFVKRIEKKLGLTIDEKKVDLLFGEASSE